MTRILITGATGFVGTELTSYLSENTDFVLRLAVRNPVSIKNHEYISVGDLNEKTDWSTALDKIDVVIHLAARVHVINESNPTPGLYKSVNTLSTINLAEQAVKAGVKRFIFLSSIKVNGESTLQGKAFTADDIPNPTDLYGRSKLDAEMALRDISDRASMGIVIIRPPLIYGPGVKANFLGLVKLVKKLPIIIFPAIQNKRSLVSVDNLNNLIKVCIDNPYAKNQTFLVSDGADLSTTDLVKEMAILYRKKILVMPFLVFFFKFFFIALKKNEISIRLFGPLQVDISKNVQLLDWRPPYSLKTCLARVIKHEV